MLAPIAIALLSLATGEGPNLLANPGFEEILVDRPVRWDVFVAPQAGAEGRLDVVSLGGKYGVMLHTPTPYPRDPANNWSQNIVGELAGKRLCARAHIKSEEATEAALWVQCFSRRPFAVLRAVTSSTDAPVYGTKDWETVEMEFDVPQGTDFLMVRCVLKGTGTAWFDDIELFEVESGKKDASTQIAEDANSEKPAKKSKKKQKPQNQEIRAETSLAAIEKLETELDRLRDANYILAEALQEIRENNQDLMSEISTLRGALHEPDGGEADSAPPLSPEAAALPIDAPPLIPYGMNWRTKE